MSCHRSITPAVVCLYLSLTNDISVDWLPKGKLLVTQFLVDAALPDLADMFPLLWRQGEAMVVYGDETKELQG